jgi:AraC family transcriptional activator of pobA
MAEKLKHYPLGQLHLRAPELVEFEILSTQKIEQLLNEQVSGDVKSHHKHAFYTVLWVDEGTCSQTLEKYTYHLEKGSVFVISPGQVHENSFEKSPGFSGGAVLFSAEFLLPLIQHEDPIELTFLDNIYFTPKLQLNDMEFAKFRQTIALIKSEEELRKSAPAITRSLLGVLLLQIQRNVDVKMVRKVSNRHIVIYKKFSNLLETTFKDNFDLTYYSNALDITTRHLGRLIKEASGKTVGELIISRKLLEAKRLLSFTDLTIAQIAGGLGYFDNSYFNKIFKKATGLTPKSFRLEMSR